MFVLNVFVADVLYAHFRDKKKDPIHKGLGQRKTNFRNFLTCYNLALATTIRAEELPKGHHCFEWQYVLEQNRAESQRFTDEDITLEPSNASPV